MIYIMEVLCRLIAFALMCVIWFPMVLVCLIILSWKPFENWHDTVCLITKVGKYANQ